MEKSYYRKGSQVIYHFKEWRRVYYNESGYDMVPTWKRAIILSQPRDSETGMFTNDFRWEDSVSVKLKDAKGKVFTATLDEIEPDVDPSTLSEEELVKLFGEIIRGSIYFSDYRNSLGVFEEVASDAYDGYWEFLTEELSHEEAEKKECAEGFAEYCQGVEYFRESLAA